MTSNMKSKTKVKMMLMKLDTPEKIIKGITSNMESKTKVKMMLMKLDPSRDKKKEESKE